MGVGIIARYAKLEMIFFWWGKREVGCRDGDKWVWEVKKVE